MMSSDGIHPFAIEHAPDGLYYLHTDRAPNKWSVAFDVNRQPQGEGVNWSMAAAHSDWNSSFGPPLLTAGHGNFTRSSYHLLRGRSLP